jgi:antitoxin component YwqK of YwqJK toxin-antitoxin module
MKLVRIALLALPLLVGCSVSTRGGTKVVERYESGQKKSEGYVLADGKKAGPWTAWHDNGQKEGEGEFKKGKSEGLWTIWHKNGRKALEGEFKNGQREGRCTEWDGNGQKRAEGEFKNDKWEGRWVFWSKDGSLNAKQSGIYKAGKKVAPLPKK